MFRKLIVILITWFVFYSAQTSALGLGSIELNSGLNQPFDATIKLVARNEAELEGLRVGLASNADFDRIGAVRLPFLNDLKFEIISLDGAKPYIKITSSRPVREPFVDFVLEANWPAGRLLREYTVLLDPPTITTERAAPIQAPTVNRAPSVAPVLAPRRQQEPSFSGGGLIEPTTTASVVSTSDLVFGPVGANDTLWNIADSMRPSDDVSVQQMMIALLKENPDAFGNDNINNLKRGKTLRIEDQSVIAELSHKQAVAETSRQYQDWLVAKQARRAARGQIAKQQAVAVSVGDNTASAEGGVASPEESEGDAVPEGGLRLLADDALEDSATQGGVAQVSGVSGDINELREELELTTFAVEASREQNVQLRERMTGLEEQITAMQRALQLKDDTLTQLQQKLAEPTDAVTSDSATESAVEPIGIGVIETLPLELEEKAEIISEGIEPDVAVVDESGTVTEEAVSAVEMIKDEVAVSESVSPQESNEGDTISTSNMLDTALKNASNIGNLIKDKATNFFSNISLNSIKEVLQPENILQRYRDNPLIFRIISGIIAVLVILGLIVRRRRIAAKEQFEEFAAPQMNNVDDVIESIEEDTFGIGVVDGETADVLGEADVYISYQRYDKAEALLKHAIDNESSRVDLKVKLLEVYHGAKNIPAFISSADEDHVLLSEDKAVWSQINAMGLELAPEHHLFSGDSATAAEFDKLEGFDTLDDIDDSDVGVDDYADIDLDMDVLTADGDVLNENKDEPSTADGAEALYDEASKDLEDEFGLELDVGDDAPVVDVDGEAGAEESQGSALPPLAAEESAFAQAEGHVEEEQVTPSIEPAVEVNDQADAPSLLERAMDNAAANPDGTNFNEKFGSTNMGDSVGEPLNTYNPDDDNGDGEAYDASLFAGVDVVSTKLDLAKAYIDMGDQDGARSILGEVVAEGTDDQQKEAQALIDQL